MQQIKRQEWEQSRESSSEATSRVQAQANGKLDVDDDSRS